MATRSSRYCAGCTACKIVHVVLIVYVAVHFALIDYRPLCVAATVSYMAVHATKALGDTAGLQLVQATMCLVIALNAADCTRCAVAIWLALCATILHIGMAITLYELARLGDCARCWNEAHMCGCGRQKQPVKPGSLRTLVELIEVLYIPAARREPAGSAPGSTGESGPVPFAQVVDRLQPDTGLIAIPVVARNLR